MKIPWPKRVQEAIKAFDDDDLPPLPVQQTIPLPAKEPPVSNHQGTVRNGDNLAVLTKAHEIVQKIEAERDADKAEIDKLKGELAELTMRLASEKRKVDALHLDLVTAANNTAVLQTQCNEMRQLLSLQRQLMDRWEIKAPPKKVRPRKVKAVKAEPVPK